MSCVAGHQPNLYPYGGFFAKMASVDEFVIVDNTQYVKKQYHNRNRILELNGNARWLSIPVKNSGRFKQRIFEVEVDNDQNWRKSHLKTLMVNYRKAAFFDLVFPEVEKILTRDWNKLADYTIAFINMCVKIMNISTPIKLASDLGVEGKATELILDLCRKTGADTYLHGIHSRDYVDFDRLSQAGIKNLVQTYQEIEFKQTAPGFTPNLSILDILFNCGSNSLKTILAGNHIQRS